MKRFDVLIVGAGAVGNAIAREISKQNHVTVGVLEKEPDTAFGVSGRNSGVLHAGFNNKPGSFMAKLCVEGSEGFEKEAAELNVDFRKTGKLIVARFEEDLERLQKLKAQGEENGVRELRIIGREELEDLIGYDAGVGALRSGMTGIFDPFQYTIALAEAAAAQGAEYLFGRQVTGITQQVQTPVVTSQRHEGSDSAPCGFLVTAENLAAGQTEQYQAGILINSAGLYSDEICRMAGINDFKIFPCRGEYHILDRKQSKLLKLPIYPVPNEKEGGLGVHLTPTLHGNIMIGPSAEYLEAEQEREEYGTTLDVMAKLSEEGVGLFPKLDVKDCIRSFSGVRPKLASESQGGYADFVIEVSSQVPGFIQLVGIESPGLTASIPIAKMVADMVRDIMERNGSGDGLAADENDEKDRAKAYFGEPGDEKMLCRCEGITEKAVLEAYDRILKIGAIPTVKGLKNRSRVTMGSCQGSFCTVDLIELLQKKRNVDPLTLLWNGFGSEMFVGRVKE
jgi:glycerol-3-phosphate dehydrogenase